MLKVASLVVAGTLQQDPEDVSMFAKAALLDQIKNEIGKAASIRGMWTFDETGAVSTLTDLSGNGRALTLRNSSDAAINADTLSPTTAGLTSTLLFNGSDVFDIADDNGLSFGNGTVDQAMSIIWCGNPVSVSGHMIAAKWNVTTGATAREWVMYFATGTEALQFELCDDSTGGYIGRRSASVSGDVGSNHCYISSYNGKSVVSGICLYRDGQRFDATNSTGGSYTAMENKGAKAGSYTTNAGGSKIFKANAHFAFLAIIAGELTQQQAKRISDLLLRWVGVTTAQYPAGTELVSNGTFTDTTGWTATAGTIAAVSGGVEGSCLELTRTSGSTQYAQATVTGLTVGKVYKATTYAKSGTSGNELGHILFGTSNYRYFTTSSTWTQSPALYFVATATSHTVEVGKDTSTAGTMLFDTVSVVEVGPTSIFGVRTRSWMRNTALSGSVDASGLPNFISAGTGLACNLSASSTPLTLTFAVGFDAEGQVDFVSRINEDITHAWTGLTDSTTNFLYINRDPVTGLLTFGATTVNPDVRMAKNGSPSSGMHNLIRPEVVMYAYTSSWAAVQRVFVGKAVTSGGSVTSVTIFRYGMDWLSITTGGGPTKTLTDGATIEWDLRESANMYLEVTGTGRTLNVRGLLDGSVYRGRIKQGSGGSKTITTWAFYKSDGVAATVEWYGGSAPTLSTTAGHEDYLEFWYDEPGGTVLARVILDFF